MENIRLKYLCSSISGGGTPDSKNADFYTNSHSINWMTIAGMLSLDSEETKFQLTKKGILSKNLKIYKKGTLLYSIYATLGRTMILPFDSSINQAILAIVPKKNNDPRYLKYCLMDKVDEIEKYSSTSTQPNLSLKKVQNFYISKIPYDSQIKKADYLDSFFDGINKKIEECNRAIETVNNLIYSEISHSVSIGIHASKKITKNMFPWQPEVNSLWKKAKIKYISNLSGRIGWQGLTSSEYKEKGPFLITGTDFINGTVNWETCVHITMKRYKEAPQIMVKEGDLLITKDGTIGKVAIVRDIPDDGFASLNSGILLVRKRKNIYTNQYIFYLLQSRTFWDWFYYSSREASTIEHLYQHQFSNFEFCMPSIDEQKEIVNYLNVKIDKLKKLVDLKNDEIIQYEKLKKAVIRETILRPEDNLHGIR